MTTYPHTCNFNGCTAMDMVRLVKPVRAVLSIDGGTARICISYGYIFKSSFAVGGIAQWQSIRLQIERSPVQLRLPPVLDIFLFFLVAQADLRKSCNRRVSLSLSLSLSLSDLLFAVHNVTINS